MVKIQTEQVLLDMLGYSLHLSPGVCPLEADLVSELLSLPYSSPSLSFSAFLTALLVITHPCLKCLCALLSLCPLHSAVVPLLPTSSSSSLLLP